MAAEINGQSAEESEDNVDADGGRLQRDAVLI